MVEMCRAERVDKSGGELKGRKRNMKATLEVYEYCELGHAGGFIE